MKNDFIMFKSYIQKLIYQELAPESRSTISYSKLLKEMEGSEYLHKTVETAISRAVGKELSGYKREFAESAKRATDFLQEEAFLDKIVERIRRKQL